MSFDLHGIDWNNITVPGRACYSSHDIQLHNGQASIPVPSARPPGGYVLRRNMPAQYGELANGPSVAVLGLLCAGTGSYSGTGTFWPRIAVFDAQGGQPHLLGLFTTEDLGRVPASGSGIVPSLVQVRAGVITVAGSYWQPQDAHCCPSGRATTTITYRNGTLVASGVLSTAPASPGSATSGVVPTSPAPGTGRKITATGYSGQTYVATVQAEDTVSDCAANSYGAAVISYFEQHPCPHGAGRRLVTIPFHGRTVALSMIAVDAQVGPQDDLYLYAAQLAHLEKASGTGGLDDLLRSGVRPAGWPAAIPSNETFVINGEDDTVDVFDAWYLTGPTASQDPALTGMINDIFLTPITVGPF